MSGVGKDRFLFLFYIDAPPLKYFAHLPSLAIPPLLYQNQAYRPLPPLLPIADLHAQHWQRQRRGEFYFHQLIILLQTSHHISVAFNTINSDRALTTVATTIKIICAVHCCHAIFNCQGRGR